MRIINRLIIIVVILAGLSAISWWMAYNPVQDFTQSVPGMDNRPEGSKSSGEIVWIGNIFNNFTTEKSELTGSWTGFRGQDRDNIVKDKIPLKDKLSDDLSEILWTVSLGEGHAAPVIQNGKAYILDYIEEKKQDALRCFSLTTGKELWSRAYEVNIKRNHGMSRTVPAITEDYLITIGPRCHIMCLNPESGELLWSMDLVKDYQTEVPFWYTGQCPIIDNNIAVFAPGGKDLIIGVDCSNGEVVWRTPNPNNWKMSHSSIMPITFNGKKMYIYAAVGGITGVSAEKEDIGTILWETKDFNPTVVAPSPVALDDGKFFMTAGYGAGGALFQLKQEGNSYNVETLQKYKPKDGLASEQQSPIFWNGQLFSVLPKDAAGNRNQFVSVKAEDCMNILWTSGKKERYGLGPYILADNKFYILNDDGTLSIAKASTKGFEIIDQKRLIKGHDAWGPIAIADGYILLRDSKTMLCLDMNK